LRISSKTRRRTEKPSRQIVNQLKASLQEKEEAELPPRSHAAPGSLVFHFLRQRNLSPSSRGSKVHQLRQGKETRLRFHFNEVTSPSK